MPIYEYECLKCGEKFELRRSMDDADINVGCHKCGVEKVKRVFSLFTNGSAGNVCAPSNPT